MNRKNDQKTVIPAKRHSRASRNPLMDSRLRGNDTINYGNDTISEAAALLRAGELVAFPTETVYGLGADASNPQAVEKIFLAKGRPANHPVIVHIYEFAQLNYWAKSIPAIASQLAEYFWPGPMTLILPAAEHVSPKITGGQSTIGIRMPSHPVARELLKTFGGAIAAPSANRFGRISPTSAAHVQAELGDSLKCILDGGNCPLGLESTIINVTQTPPQLLRPGPLTIEDIAQIAGVTVVAVTNPAAIRVSGNLSSHYAPHTPLILISSQHLKKSLMRNKKIAVIALQSAPPDFPAKLWRKMPQAATAYAQQLYAALREFDAAGVDEILVELPPADNHWRAIHDRLKRAAH